MTRGERLFLSCLAIYYCAAMLTGAHVYQHRAQNSESRVERSVVSGFIWPLYWSARAAMKMTE